MIFLELSTFIGRLHPLVVHLPIGFLVLALIFDLPLVKKRNSAVSLIWFFASIFSIVAVVLGLLLAQNGHYIEQQLSLHQWSGIILVFLCFIGWMSRSPFFRFPDFIRKVNNGIVILTLIIVGHYGGTLTHGENYLFVYAPEWLSSKLIKEKTDPKFADVSLDSVYVYQDMIQPLFNAKCVSCHNNEAKRGGLDMTNVKGLFKGGNSGAAIVQKNLAKILQNNKVILVYPIPEIPFYPLTEIYNRSGSLNYDNLRKYIENNNTTTNCSKQTRQAEHTNGTKHWQSNSKRGYQYNPRRSLYGRHIPHL